MGKFLVYSPECLEGKFSEVRVVTKARRSPGLLFRGLLCSRSRCARDPKNTPSSSARRPSPRESCRPIVGYVNVPIMVGVGAILLVVRLYPVAPRHADTPVGHYPQDC